MKSALGNFRQMVSRLAAVSVLALLVSCTSSTENAIVGEWREIDGTEVVQFLEAGTVTIASGGMSMRGSYEFVDDNKIRLDVDLLSLLAGGPVLTEISISDDQLTMTMPDGDLSTYRRLH